jgi:hypothetical protein
MHLQLKHLPANFGHFSEFYSRSAPLIWQAHQNMQWDSPVGTPACLLIAAIIDLHDLFLVSVLAVWLCVWGELGTRQFTSLSSPQFPLDWVASRYLRKCFVTAGYVWNAVNRIVQFNSSRWMDYITMYIFEIQNYVNAQMGSIQVCKSVCVFIFVSFMSIFVSLIGIFVSLDSRASLFVSRWSRWCNLVSRGSNSSVRISWRRSS